MPTIRDVAIAANVSVATVSRVLNDSESVRPETRSRVLQAITALNYRPDPIARRLSTGRTLTVGVLLPFLTRPSYVERLRGIEAAVSYADYDLVVSNVETRAKRDASITALTTKRRFDGALILSLQPTHAEASALAGSDIAVVLVDCAHPLLSSLTIDNRHGGQMAAHYLVGQGHRDVAFLSDSLHPLGFTASQERLAGFQETLKAHNITLNTANILMEEHGRREAKVAALSLLARPASERPTALFAASDVLALGALDALREVGLRAPDDLAVLGFDDIEMAETYNLTTIRQPLYESGMQGVERLWRQMESAEYPPQTQILPLELIIRKTA